MDGGWGYLTENMMDGGSRAVLATNNRTNNCSTRSVCPTIWLIQQFASESNHGLVGVPQRIAVKWRQHAKNRCSLWKSFQADAEQQILPMHLLWLVVDKWSRQVIGVFGHYVQEKGIVLLEQCSTPEDCHQEMKDYYKYRKQLWIRGTSPTDCRQMKTSCKE